MIIATQTQMPAKKLGFKEGVKLLCESGFDGLDVSMFYEDDYPFKDDYRQVAAWAKEYAASKGVSFVQAHAPFGGQAPKYIEKWVSKFETAFEFASILGVKNIVVHPLQEGRYYGNEDVMFERNVEFYNSLKPLAKRYGLKIAIENMWQCHPVTRAICDDVCAPPEDLARYYDALNDPEVFTVCLDIGHVALCGREPENAIRYLGHRLGCIHAHDVDYVSDLHTLPGVVGKINWNEVCKALGEIDFKGPFTLEADEFYRGFDIELYPDVSAFMAKATRRLADKVDSYRP